MKQQIDYVQRRTKRGSLRFRARELDTDGAVLGQGGERNTHPKALDSLREDMKRRRSHKAREAAAV